METQEIMNTLLKIQENMATKEDINIIKLGNDRLQKEIEGIKSNFNKKILDLEKTVEILLQKLHTSDNVARARNVLIFKVEENLNEKENTLKKIMEIFRQIGIDINEFCIEAAYRIGKPGNNRPILVRFIAPRWKSLLFKKIKEFADMGMAISNDQTKEERLERKELVMFKNKLNLEGGRNIKIKGKKLWIDNKEFTLEDLRSMEENVMIKDLSDTSAKQHSDPMKNATPTKKANARQNSGTKRQLLFDTSISKFLVSPDIKRVKSTE